MGAKVIFMLRERTMPGERSQASEEDVTEAIREIRAYHDQGRQSLRELPERGKHGARAIDEQAERLGWNPTRLRKARQFARAGEGYSRDRLNELCRLLREHRPVFGTAHVGLLVTVPWPEREEIQRKCVEGNWSMTELQAELKRRYGSRKEGGRRRQVPSEPADVLLQIDELADSWERWYKVIAPKPEEGQKKKTILRTLPENVQERVRAVNKAIKQLREVVTAALEAIRKKASQKT
jgi:hypothetical protein